MTPDDIDGVEVSPIGIGGNRRICISPKLYYKPNNHTLKSDKNWPE